MEGLGIFGDLPQLDPLPAVGSNHDNASHTHDDRVNIFGDLPQLDQLPVVGSKHAEEGTQQAILRDGDHGTKALEPSRHRELLELLPLRPPRWRRLGAAVAAAVIVAAEGTSAGQYSSGGTEPWLLHGLAGALATLLLAAVLWAVLGPSQPIAAALTRDTATQTDTVSVRHVQSQAPTTYTAVRGATDPRFQPLPDRAHG